MDIGEIYDILPLTERTFLKRVELGDYDFTIDNTDHPSEYILIREGVELGMVKYYQGRLLTCYDIRPRQSIKEVTA